jgi:hypothetical protein
VRGPLTLKLSEFRKTFAALAPPAVAVAKKAKVDPGEPYSREFVRAREIVLA